jgi:hypothetical protein
MDYVEERLDDLFIALILLLSTIAQQHGRCTHLQQWLSLNGRYTAALRRLQHRNAGNSIQMSQLSSMDQGLIMLQSRAASPGGCSSLAMDAAPLLSFI